MSISKSKVLARKAVKQASAADKSRYRVAGAASSAVHRKPERLSAPRRQGISDRLSRVLGPTVLTVSIGEARAQIPKMVRDSATGHTFLISNARTADAPVAVLIGLEEFNRVVAEPLNTRTLGEVLAALPFSGMDLPPPEAQTLAGAGLPTAKIPA